MKLKFQAGLDIFWPVLMHLLVLINLMLMLQLNSPLLQIIIIILISVVVAILVYQGLNFIQQKLAVADFERFLRHRRQDCKIIYLGIFLVMGMARFAGWITLSMDIYFCYAAGLFLLTWTVIDWYRHLNCQPRTNQL